MHKKKKPNQKTLYHLLKLFSLLSHKCCPKINSILTDAVALD